MPKTVLPEGKRDLLVKRLSKISSIPRLTFYFKISPLRHKAIEAIKNINSKEISNVKKPSNKLVLQLLNSENVDEQNAGIALMEYTTLTKKDVANTTANKHNRDMYMGLTYSEANAGVQNLIKENKGNELKVLDKQIVNYREWFDQKAAIKAKAEHILGMKTPVFMENMEKLSKNYDSLISQAVASKLKEVGEKGLPLLIKYMMFRHASVRSEAIRSFMSIVKELPKKKRDQKIKELVTHNHRDIRIAIAAGLPRLGKEAIPFLKELTNDEHHKVKAVANASKYLLDNDLPADEWGVTRYPHKYTRYGADFQELLMNRKSLFATPHTEELIKRLGDLNRITNILKKEFGDDFVGMNIVGSTEKGYMTPSSDLDIKVLTTNQKVYDRFKELGKDLNLCSRLDNYVDPSKKEGALGLFYGVFFGDYKRLKTFQKEAINNLTDSEWKELQEHIRFHQTNLYKRSHTFSDDNLVKHREELAALYHVPPNRKETIKIMNNRK